MPKKSKIGQLVDLKQRHSGAIGYDLTRKMVQEFCLRIRHIHAPLELEQSIILKISVQNRKIIECDCSSPKICSSHNEIQQKLVKMEEKCGFSCIIFH